MFPRRGTRRREEEERANSKKKGRRGGEKKYTAPFVTSFSRYFVPAKKPVVLFPVINKLVGNEIITVNTTRPLDERRIPLGQLLPAPETSVEAW